MDQIVQTAADLSVLHDAELYLVAMDREAAELRLGFKGVDRGVRSVSFHGVLTHRIDNVQCQNVVSRILVSDAGLPLDGDIERLVRWTSSVPGGRLLISEQKLQAHMARVRSGELRLFYAEPSWGAEIGVIAERFHLSGGQE
jgi:hypothetical protein